MNFLRRWFDAEVAGWHLRARVATCTPRPIEPSPQPTLQEAGEHHFRGPIKPTGYLTLAGGFHVAVTGDPPGRFHRWMMRVLLGWKWKAA